MTNYDKEVLISEVQIRPPLWQHHHEHFKNKNVTNKLWHEVGRASGMEGTQAKLKWKNLKDNFRREYQKYRSLRSGSKPKWQYFQNMLFLKEVVSPSQGECNLKQEVLEDAADENVCEGIQSESSSSYLPHNSSNFDNSDSFQPTSIRKRNMENFNDEYLEIQKRKLELLEKEISRSNDSDDSSDLQFFKSLLPFIECMPLLERLELRNNIQQLVLEKFKQFSRPYDTL